MEVEVPIIGVEKCQELYMKDSPVAPTNICAGYDEGGKDACTGDSGGPLVCSDAEGDWVLHGVTSWGTGCAEAGHPGVYTRVESYIGWINDVTSRK